MKAQLHAVIRLISWAVLAVSLLTAQTGTGSIQGVVKDPSGAVVPAARVAVTHVLMGRSFASATNPIGFFLVPSLVGGSYKVTVEAPGMQLWEGEVLLQAGQAAAIAPVLRLASTANEITVSGDVTPLLTTTSGTLGAVLERTRIDQLPLNGRALENLMMITTPGLEGYSGAPKANGLQWGSMEIVQDGAAITDHDYGALTVRSFGLDTVEEFRVETNNSSAKFNRPATAIATTRTGTNRVHGSVFETHRNSGLGVARRREDYFAKPPHLVRNEFGASLGGPVYLPRLYDGRNRTFFFFSYEAYRKVEAVTSTTSMPTMAMRGGDFSGLIDGTGRAITLYDPWTTTAGTYSRQPFPNNTLPISKLSQLAKYLYSVTPEPNIAGVNPLVGSNWAGPGPNDRFDHTETVRIDHRLTDRDQVFGRYTFGKRWTQQNRSLGGAPVTLDGSSNVTFYDNPQQNAMVSWTHRFSPTFFSETLATGSGVDSAIYGGTDAINHADKLGLPNPLHITGFPPISDTGFNMAYYYIDLKRNPITKVLSFEENLTKVHGRHELQFGGRFRHEDLDYTAIYQGQGSHQFGGPATGLYDPATGSAYGAAPRTGHSSANLFLGIANVYAVQYNYPQQLYRVREYAAYFQDNFRAGARLTLNLGLRWEGFPALRERNGLLTGFDRQSRSIVMQKSLDELYRLGATTPAIIGAYQAIGAKFTTYDKAGLPSSMVNGNPSNFGPRLGFAYQVTSGRRPVVLRGGYARFHYSIPYYSYTMRMRDNPPNSALFTYRLNDAQQSPDGRPNYLLRAAPPVIAGVNSKDVIRLDSPSPITRGGFKLAYLNPDQPSARAEEWNIGLEREIFAGTLARAAYVGTHGSNLEQFYTFNEAPNNYVWFVNTGLPLPTGAYAGVARRNFDQTTYGGIEEIARTGWSNYNGVQMEIRRRFDKGYGFQAYYTISNALRAGGNNWSDDFIPETNMYLAGAVPADLQERNRFLYYRRMTDIPKHVFRWNWIVDLPVGRGKLLLRNSGRLADGILGGWQIAGYGTLRSNYWALPTSNWGSLGNVEIYGKKYPISDCRSGTCYPGYLYYNGYIPANRINSYGANGRPNGVMGVPDSYRPAHQPIFPTPKDGGSPSDPNYAFYETNTVTVRLKDGTTQRTSLDTNLHPWRNQYLPGPPGFGMDASLFKNARITESVTLRFNADFFNVLNTPGLVQPDSSTGIASLRTSAVGARQMQLTLRLSW